jgi:putative ABC transport system permease protein
MERVEHCRMIPTWMELKVALRTLRRSKAFAAFAVLALALAIAANTTMSSLIDGLLWPTMAFPDPGQLVVARWTAPKATLYPKVNIRQVLGDSGRTYAGVGAWIDNGPYGQAVTVGNQALQVPMEIVSGGFFRVVGARPIHGTLFMDSTAAARHVAVISDRLWRQLGARDRPFEPFAISLTGAGLSLNGGNTLTVIGVVADNGAIPTSTDLYIPTDWNVGSEALLRLRHGVSRAEALKELNALAPNLDPAHSRFAHFTLVPASVTPGRKLGVVWALAAATLAVLIIACANIANLLLARGMARSRELATRLAFGASRLQIARLLFAESGLVALAGGVLGFLLSLWTIHLVSATLPAGLQYLGLVQPQLSWRVLVAGLGLTMVSAVVFGVAPAIALVRTDINRLLRGTGNRHTTGNRGRFQVLVVAEVAGALTLVVSASLLGAVAGKIHLMDYGYDATNLISARVPEANPGLHTAYGTAPSAALVAQRYGELQRLRAMPGVAGATAMWQPFVYGLVRVDDPGGGAPRTAIGTSDVLEVDPDFLRVLGIPILRGRNFHESEDDPIPSVIIDEGTAHWISPGADILGRLIRFAKQGTLTPNAPWMRVVGITGQVAMSRCGLDPCREHMFFIANGAGWPARTASTTYLVRSKGPASAFLTPLGAAVRSDHPGTRAGVATWDEVTGTAYLQSLYDFVTTLFGSFSLIGLLLALIGVYGMIAYAVEQRAREFGVRIALGAQTRDIVKIVLRQGNATALLGLAIGLIAANWAEQLLYGFLYGYDQMAPFFMAGAVVALFAATVLSGIPPALRASRLNPADTLRSE